MQELKARSRARTRPARRRSVEPIALEPLALTAAAPIDAQVYAHLRRTLASGAIAPGQKLSTRSLASAFGLSATPTRVALKQLLAEGVLVGRPRSGFQVAPASADDYRELIAIRCRLEGLAAREAATRLTPHALSQLQRLHDRIAAKTYAETAYLELNFAFHFTIYRAAGMPRLLDLIEALWARVGPYLHLVAGCEVQERFITSHQAILAALGQRDGMGAERALCADIERAADVIMPLLR